MSEVIEATPAELADAPASNLPAPTNPTEMLMQAVEKGYDLNYLERLMQLQERWESNQARQAFHEAMSKFKENPPQVVKDKLNKQFDSSYVSLENLVNTVNEAMAPFGLKI